MLKKVECKKEDIFSIIKAAGQEIIKIYQGDDFQVEIKRDETPLTIADRRSNQVILQGLEGLFPGIPLLSEESKKTSYRKRKEWEYLWLVDPLDGTKEFIKRNGEFTINLALINKNCPIFGMIYLPVSGLMYYAFLGSGVYKIENNGSTIKVAKKRVKHFKKRKTVRLISSKSHYNRETEEYVEKLKRKHQQIEMISIGSAMKFMYLAEGKADIYPRLAPTMEWDTAAGQIILEESGGRVLDFQAREPLVYNKEDLKNPWFVATRDGKSDII